MEVENYGFYCTYGNPLGYSPYWYSFHTHDIPDPIDLFPERDHNWHRFDLRKEPYYNLEREHNFLYNLTPEMVDQVKSRQEKALASAFKGLQFLYELPDISNFFNTVKDLLNWRKLNPFSPLAFQFGVVTPIQELRDAALLAKDLGMKLRKYTNELDRNGRVVDVRFKGNREIRWFRDFCKKGNLVFEGDLEYELLLKFKINSKLPLGLDNWGTALMRFADYWGLHPTLETIYDLTPWSWAIDRILPISESVQLLDSALGLGKKYSTDWVGISLVGTTCFQDAVIECKHIQKSYKLELPCSAHNTVGGIIRFRSYRRNVPILLQELTPLEFIRRAGGTIDSAEMSTYLALFG
jgi:hypothetical protein